MRKALVQYLKALFVESQNMTQRRIGLAGNLLERADACAGRDPRGAADLRAAAVTYLGVVR